ncbi:Uncharacterised protein [Yersinia nurmii]|uniref:Phage tail protein C-terminal domain-containing protein n=1 Tax=Yersinia nurmii TaxID=685706 RepID=A0ABP1YKC1_9GAMM|nr:hypothetical protein [Yersinia nurmii]CNE96921.1 Uncharacterised protein [Yersinia nurmii]
MVYYSMPEGGTQAGAGVVNGEAKGAVATRISEGIYQVSGAQGFALEGWQIALLTDDNRQPPTTNHQPPTTNHSSGLNGKWMNLVLSLSALITMNTPTHYSLLKINGTVTAMVSRWIFPMGCGGICDWRWGRLNFRPLDKKPMERIG